MILRVCVCVSDTAYLYSVGDGIRHNPGEFWMESNNIIDSQPELKKMEENWRSLNRSHVQ